MVKSKEVKDKQEFPLREIDKVTLVFISRKDWTIDGETKDFIILKKESDLPF